MLPLAASIPGTAEQHTPGIFLIIARTPSRLLISTKSCLCEAQNRCVELTSAKQLSRKTLFYLFYRTIIIKTHLFLNNLFLKCTISEHPNKYFPRESYKILRNQHVENKRRRGEEEEEEKEQET